MTTRLLLPRLAFLLGVASIAQPLQLPAQQIEFISVQKAIPIDDPRKDPATVTRLQVCVYDEADKVQLLARECTLVNAGKKFKWDRGGDKSKFHVRLYNWYLGGTCRRMDIPGDVIAVHVAHTPCQISLVTKATGPAPTPAPKPALESVLSVCNTSVDEKVNFAIAYVVDVSPGTGATQVVAEGWWEVGKGQCASIPSSGRLKKWRNPELDAGITITPNFFIYGETEGFFGGAIKRVMEGDESDPNGISVCINKDKNFEYRQQPTNAPAFGLAEQKKCADTRIRMAKVTRHNDDLSEFRWIF